MLTVKRATVEGGPLLSERQALAIDSRPLSLSCQNRALSRRLLLAVLLLQLPGCLASSMLAEAAHQSEMQAASRGPSNTTSRRSQTKPTKPASRHLVAKAWIQEHWKKAKKASHHPAGSSQPHQGVSSSATTGVRFKALQVRSFRKSLTIIDTLKAMLHPQPQRDARIAHRPGTGIWPSKCARKKVAVCTTINEVSEAIRAIAQLEGWCVVIVGDRITP